MKKIILAACTAILLTSCFKDNYSEMTYPLWATMEYTNPSTIFGTDSVYYKTPFSYDCLLFCNKVGEDGTFYGGFALSMAKDSTLNTKANPFSMFANSAADKSNTCAVYSYRPGTSMMPEHSITFPAAANGTCTLSGCYICNTTQVVTAILHEDSPYKFRSGEDYLKLVARGYKDNVQTGSAEYYLADWRTKDSIALGWKVFDLSKLGSIDAIDFSMESTRDGMPTSFCLDNFLASIYLKY
ncbi:MAG: DUF4465 domain-containing protein [Candidatus Cryptobacteroides sp.]